MPGGSASTASIARSNIVAVGDFHTYYNYQGRVSVCGARGLRPLVCGGGSAQCGGRSSSRSLRFTAGRMKPGPRSRKR
eukprot:3620865-Prymnesium_polylepis.1